MTDICFGFKNKKMQRSHKNWKSIQNGYFLLKKHQNICWHKPAAWKKVQNGPNSCFYSSFIIKFFSYCV
ncbi:unnamed protein product [Larinioides sclopetarius]|uniref:Ribosomal protein L32 n=1 Tax=Larinioides sclopetarius TaxID=280406 RepID=A0AAV2AKK0_9ARAC